MADAVKDKHALLSVFTTSVCSLWEEEGYVTVLQIEKEGVDRLSSARTTLSPASAT